MSETEEKRKILREVLEKIEIDEEAEIIKKIPQIEKKENPFKNLHYATEHLPMYKEFTSLINLYGKHYIPIKKCRWYQLYGGILQKKITLGNLKTDTRIQVCYPIVTEGGKNDIIYAIKNLCEKGIRKNSSELFKLSEPISFHQEALIGKMVERLQDNPSGKGKPIKVRIENKGHLANDFVEFDECNQLITSNTPDMQQAREYLSKAENSIGRNKVEKRSVEDLENETIAYFPHSTHSYYFQPFTKLPEGFVLQGFGRRKFIPVGNISKFLTSANEKLYFDKLNAKDFSEEEYKEIIIEHLEKMRRIFEGRDFLFTEKANDLLQKYALNITGQAQLHSEKIYNFIKVSKFTCLSNLVKMSCILAGSYFQNEVTEDFVSLAYMDLVEIMQSTFDFIEERIQGNFDYGTKWEGADYKQIECLKHLYDRNALSFDSSDVTIEDFLGVIMPVYKIKESQARNRYLEMKNLKLIDSKQYGQNSSKVWLNFNPTIQENELEGNKGYKGYNAYNSIFLGINTILSRVKSLQPLQPLAKLGEY